MCASSLAGNLRLKLLEGATCQPCPPGTEGVLPAGDLCPGTWPDQCRLPPQTLMIRDWWMCMIISVMFEFLEYSLEHQLPNFSECWWDHVGAGARGRLVDHLGASGGPLRWGVGMGWWTT